MNEQDINYTKEAFLTPWNLAFLLVGMLSAFVISVATGGGADALFNLILILTGAFELLYLGIMPRNERFQRAVKARHAAEHAKPPSQREIYQVLHRSNQRRYGRLRDLEKKIEANYRKLPYASQGLLESHLKKIDGLLDSYLNLLYQKERYAHFLRSTSEDNVVHAIEELRADMEDDSDRVRAIKQRRLRILESRLGRFKRGNENLEIIEAQLETIEDVTKYVHEQSLTLRNPEEITFQLDTLLSEVEETEASIDELDDVFATQGDLLSGIDTYEAPVEEEPLPRDRLRE